MSDDQSEWTVADTARQLALDLQEVEQERDRLRGEVERLTDAVTDLRREATNAEEQWDRAGAERDRLREILQKQRHWLAFMEADLVAAAGEPVDVSGVMGEPDDSVKLDGRERNLLALLLDAEIQDMWSTETVEHSHQAGIRHLTELRDRIKTADYKGLPVEPDEGATDEAEIQDAADWAVGDGAYRPEGET